MKGRHLLFLNNQGLDQTGGGVTILRRLAEHFARGNRVTVLAGSRSVEPLRGVEEIVVEPMPRLVGPLWRIAPLLRARHLARRVPRLAPEVDVVVALDCHFERAWKRLSPAVRVYVSLSAIPRQEYYSLQPAGRRALVRQYTGLERSMIGAADLVVVASETQRDEIREHEGLPDFDPLVLAPVFPFGPLPERTIRSEAETKVVLVVARLIPLKGVHLAIEMARRIADLNCRWVIVGDGPERETLEQMAVVFGVAEKVEFAGAQADMRPYLADADVLFHPSRYESFGMAVFEAMLAGVPVVCGRRLGHTVTACAEFVEDGVSGSLVVLDNHDEVAQALRDLIAQKDVRAKRGRAAREKALAMLETDYAESFERALDERVR